MLNGDAPVYASLAPSFIANYEGVGIESMRKALKQLGFADAEETAIGATMVKREYERILREEERELLRIERQHPDAYLRSRRPAAVAQHLPARALDLDGRAGAQFGVLRLVGNRIGEHPRMPPSERALASWP